MDTTSALSGIPTAPTLPSTTPGTLTPGAQPVGLPGNGSSTLDLGQGLPVSLTPPVTSAPQGPTKVTPVVTAQGAIDNNKKIGTTIDTATTAAQQQASALAVQQKATADAKAQADKEMAANTPTKPFGTQTDGAITYQPVQTASGTYTIANNGDIVSGPSSGTYQVGSNINQYPDLYKQVTGQDSAGNYQDQTTALQKQTDDAYNTFKTTLNQYQTGTIPLTAAQQAQLNSMQQLAQQAHDAQLLANKAYEGGTEVLQNKLGLTRYSPALAQGAIKAAVDQGLQKIQALDAKAAQALAEMTQSFQDSDFKAANAAYEAFSNYAAQKQNVMTQTHNDLVAAKKDIQDRADQAAKDQAVAQQKLSDSITNILGDVGKIGTAPAEVLSAIQNAGSSEDAAALAAPYLKDPLDTKYKIAQINALYAQAQKDAATAQTGGLDAGEVMAYATQMAETGVRPTGVPKGAFGYVAQIASDLPKKDGEVVGNFTNVRDPKLTPVQLDGLAAGKTLLQQTLPALKTAYWNAWTGLGPGLADKVGIRSADMAEFQSLRQQFLTDLLKMKSGLVVTEQEYKRYADMLPSSFSGALGLPYASEVPVLGGFGEFGSKQIDVLQKQLETNLNNTLKVNGSSMYGWTKIEGPNGKTYTVGQLVPNEAGQLVRILPNGEGQLIEQ